jgi:GNAT superfamily N-acetyltransferase
VTHSADELAYWLEVAEARVYAETYLHAIGDALDPHAVVDGDGATFWLGGLDVGFFNRCIGLGIGQPATEAAVDAVLSAFRAGGASQFVVQVSPFARPSSVERWLEQRGLRRGRRWAKVWRDTEDLPTEQTSLRIERVGLAERDAWVTVVLAAFEMPAELGPMIGSTIELPGWSHYLALDGETPVGTAAVRVMGDVAWLGFGATLDSYRGRGSQSAMFARRLRDAHEVGVRLCITETGEDLPDEPNPSYRNMLRSGFRLAYLRQNWLPPAPEGSPA